MSLVDDMVVTTERLVLSPLVPEDAEEMADVFGDERLHEFIGGRPASADALRVRYQKLAAGSSRPGETWLNWTVRRREDDQAVGTMQATVIDHDASRKAYVAWVIGVPWQNIGFATEAGQALVAWLQERDVDDIIAHVHPDHHASARVAARVGLKPTDEYVDEEQVWKSTNPI